MVIQRIEEFKIDSSTKKQIADLLNISFSGYPNGRTFYKQLPSFRYLIWNNDKLVAHMAVDHRMMNNNSNAIAVFGVSDLCVLPAYQHQKIASQLINQLEELGKKNSIDFIVLMANDHQLYLSNGFEAFENECQWLIIDNNKSLGVIHRRIKEALMVKPLGNHNWQEGFVDFLGHIF